MWQPTGMEWGLAAGLESNDFSPDQLHALESASKSKDAQSLEDMFDDFLNQELIGYQHSEPGMVCPHLLIERKFDLNIKR